LSAKASHSVKAMVEQLVRFRPTRHITGHFGDESSQAIICIGTDNKGNERNKACTQKPKRPTKHALSTLTEKSKATTRPCPGLVTSYEIQPGTEWVYSGTHTHMLTNMSVLTLALCARLSWLLVSF